MAYIVRSKNIKHDVFYLLTFEWYKGRLLYHWTTDPERAIHFCAWKDVMPMFALISEPIEIEEYVTHEQRQTKLGEKPGQENCKDGDAIGQEAGA